MAVRAQYLADKSALARMPVAAVRERLEPLLVEGLVATCGIIDLQVGYSARNGVITGQAHQWVVPRGTV